MKEFIEKLIERLEEYQLENAFEVNNRFIGACKDISIQLAKEYNNGWILCSERLPETHENVLICQSDGYVNVGWYSLNEFKDMNSISYKDVIAWQPLPAPYTERE
jgi:hypothetical protein